MNQYKILLFFLVMIFFSVPSLAVEKGGLLSVSFLPKGFGKIQVPYSGGSVGTAKTETETSEVLSSANGYGLLAGCYYGSLQADANYFSSKVTNQKFTGAASSNEIISAKMNCFEIRVGKRFSNPGDPSYSFLYLGAKRFGFSSSHEDLDFSATGYTAGYYGFYSFGVNSDFEFLVTAGCYAGTYRKYDFSSDGGFDNLSKNESLSVGGSLGVGVNYEPYNIAFLFKFVSQFNTVSFDADYSGSNFEIGLREFSNYLGFEIIYLIPDKKYNRLN